jgi:hypothetical protein
MAIKKTVILTDTIENSKGQRIAEMQTHLTGDGSTPVVMTMGTSEPIGYTDEGKVILPDDDDAIIKKRQQEFMAAAIAEQKDFCKQNGVDPSLVNIIGAENKEDK